METNLQRFGASAVAARAVCSRLFFELPTQTHDAEIGLCKWGRRLAAAKSGATDPSGAAEAKKLRDLWRIEFASVPSTSHAFY